MEEVMLASISDKQFAERLVKYLEYSEIPARLEENEELEEFSVFVPEEKKSLAGTHLSVFVHMEKQRADEEFGSDEEPEEEAEEGGEVKSSDRSLSADAEENGEAAENGEASAGDSEAEEGGEAKSSGRFPSADAEDNGEAAENDEASAGDSEAEEGGEASACDAAEEDNVAKSSDRSLFDDEEDDANPAARRRSSVNVYTSRDEVSKDMSQTAVTFFGFAVVLIVITVLCALKVSVFANFSNIIVFITLPLLAVGCAAVGLNSKKRQKLAESEASEEHALRDAVVAWLNENMTKELIMEKDDPDASIEINYMNRTEFISAKFDEQFPDIDDVFKEALIEEHYNKLFS